MTAFSDRLRALRSKSGLSQSQLADKLKISKSAIGMYERGEREPNFELLHSMSDLFEVTTDYLTGHSGKPDLTRLQERELSLQALIDIRDALRRGERGDIPEAEADRLADYLDFQIERIQKELAEQK